jgi:hypothetical protein
LQRRLKVGYARAARILDLLEREGMIGPGEGAKPREILRTDFASNDRGSAEPVAMRPGYVPVESHPRPPLDAPVSDEDIEEDAPEETVEIEEPEEAYAEETYPSEHDQT